MKFTTYLNFSSMLVITFIWLLENTQAQLWNSGLSSDSLGHLRRPIPEREPEGIETSNDITHTVEVKGPPENCIIQQCIAEKGNMGFPGIPGSPGKQGKKGSKGDPGPSGPQGQKGERGPRGFRGVRGPKGIDGDKGFPGRDGRNGIDGFPGRPGTPGLSGDKGEKGFKGDDCDKDQPEYKSANVTLIENEFRLKLEEITNGISTMQNKLSCQCSNEYSTVKNETGGFESENLNLVLEIPNRFETEFSLVKTDISVMKNDISALKSDMLNQFDQINKSLKSILDNINME